MKTWGCGLGIVLVGALVTLALFVGCSPRSDAAALYAKHCARCHGADGRGDPRSVGLYPDLNLTQAAPVKLQARGILYRRIAQGYGAMPGFSHRLEEDEIEALVAYMNNFAVVPRGR